MDKIGQIREHTPVVCSNGDECGMVDKVEGGYIKLTKDDYGDHHWFPVEWVAKVDSRVHLDRPGDQVRREWKSVAPARMTSESDQNQATAAF